MCAGHSHEPRAEPSLASTYRNLVHGEGWIGSRLLTAGMNLLRRGPRLASCCGHYGEPGC